MASIQTFPQRKEIQQFSQPLNASVSVPGSKSITNRALMLAALSQGETCLVNALFSDDTQYFCAALKQLGFEVNLDHKKSMITVVGLGGAIPVVKGDLDIGNAGTAARFLTAFLTLGNGSYILDGSPRMRERPIGDLLDALKQIGAHIEPLNPQSSQVCPPIKITGSGLVGGSVRIAGNISSQYLSALLMVAPYAESPVEIEVTTELNSRPYIDLTLSVMSDFGIDVLHEDYREFHINPARYSNPAEYEIESDASAASYFFAVPAVCGGSIRVENISTDSRQGDIQFLDILAEMGCTISHDDYSITVTGPEKLLGLDVDMRHISDTAQTLAVIAPFAISPTRIRGIASARVKESDRISATCAELRRIGVIVDEHADGMTIYPAEHLHGANIQTYNDHRMAMAFSLVGLRVPGIIIEDPACVTKTFPQYFNELEKLQ